MDFCQKKTSRVESSPLNMEKSEKPCLVETLLTMPYEESINGPQFLSSQLTSQIVAISFKNSIQLISGKGFTESIKTLSFSSNIHCFLFVDITNLLYVNVGDELFIFNVSSDQEFKFRFAKKYGINQITADSSGSISFADTHGKRLQFSKKILNLLNECPTHLSEIKIELFPVDSNSLPPNKPRQDFFGTPLSICRILQNSFVLKCSQSGQKTEVKVDGSLIDIMTFKDELNILILKQQSHSLEYVIMLLRYPDMIKLLEVPVLNNCHLVGGLGTTAYFTQFDNTSLKLCSIQQMTPLQNLQCLVESGSYSEAEQLALKHGLSLEEVYKLKVKHLLTGINEIDNVTINEFFEVFKKLKDVPFIYNSALQAVELSMEFIPLLKFLKLFELNDTWIMKIEEYNAKFDVYNLIPHVFRGKVTYFKWQYFIQCSFIDIYKQFISSYKFDLACSAFLRSSPLIKSLLTIDIVSELLYSLPSDAKLQDLFIWLGNLIPFAINSNPYFTDVVAKWSVERIHMLELNKNWPKIGIVFADKIMTFVKCDSILYIPPSLRRLYFFKSSLKHVLALKSKYNVKNVSFKDFITNDHYSIVKAILHRTFIEDLNKVIREFLIKFMREYGVSQDQILKDHIDEQLCDNIDERRLEILLEYIYDADIKANCILEILKAASIPWSKTIESFASLAIKICPRIAKTIRVEMLYTQVKCCLLKYDISDFETDIEMVIMRIVSKELPEMANDIEKVILVYKKWKEFAYIMTICKQIQTNKLDTALCTFNKFNEIEQKRCKKTLILQLENLLTLPDEQNLLYIYNFVDFLKIINISNSEIAIFENCINMRLCHDIFILPSEYYVNENRKVIFNRWCESELTNKLVATEVQKHVNRALNLAKCLNIGFDFAIEKIFNNINTEMSPSDLYWMISKASALSLNPSEFIKNTVSVISKNSNNLSPYIHLLNHTISRALVRKNMDLMKYAYITSALKSLSTYSENKSNYSSKVESYRIKYMSDEFTSLPMLKERLLLLTTEQSKICSLNIKYFISQNWKNNMRSSREIDMIGVFSETAVYKISYLASYECLDNFVNLLLKKLVLSRQYDALIFSAILKLHSSPNNWLSKIDTFFSDFTDSNKRNTITSLVSKIGPLFGKSSINHKVNTFIKCQNLMSFVDKYSHETKLSDFDDITQSKPVILEIFSQNVEHLSLDIIDEMCTLTGVSRDEGYTFYLFSLINGSDVKFNVIVDHFGTKHVILKNDEYDLVYVSSQIIDRIKNREHLIMVLKTFYKNGEICILNHTFTINQYHYEVYICIIHLISKLKGQQIYCKDYMLLIFLKHYFRTSPPKNCEIDLYKFKGCFPEISYYRLPFQPFLSKDLWKSLKSSEINLTTYQQWLPVVALLPLNVDTQTAHDMLCSNAVKQSMTTKRNSINKLTEWSLTLENNLLLKKAYECVQLISNPEWATACLFYVLQGSKSGADQVAAAALCYEFTESRSKTQSISFTDKMKNKYIIANTMHILYKFDLADKSLLKLCDMPLNLIKELYNHSSLKQEETPSVNKAVDEIAETYGLNKAALKTEIFEEILDNAEKSSNLNDTTDVENQIKNIFLNEDDVRRANYVFQTSTPVLTGLYLSRYALDTSIQIPLSKRLKYLQCLLSLTDPEILENVSKLTYNDIWSKVWEIYFMNAFQVLDILDLNNLFKEDKFKTMSQIWNYKNIGNASPIVFIIMKMAFIYDSRPVDFVNDFLILALKCEHFKELKDFLTLLPAIDNENIIKAYSELISGPFDGLEDSFTEAQKQNCMLALKFLYACPLYCKIDLMKIWKKCISIKRFDIASILLPFMPEKNRCTLTKQLGNNFRRLFSNLELISSEYYFPIEVIKFIIKECVTGE